MPSEPLTVDSLTPDELRAITAAALLYHEGNSYSYSKRAIRTTQDLLLEVIDTIQEAHDGTKKD